MKISYYNYGSNISFASCSRTYKKNTKDYPEQTRKDIGLSVGTKSTKEGFELSNLSGTKINYVCKNVCTLTHLFRPDVDWGDLMKVLNKDFKYENKVNVYSLAGSDGSEGYTFAMAVMDRLPKDQQAKYFKIRVSDIDNEVIRAAKSGIINLSATDIELMQNNLKIPKEYFRPTKNTLYIANNEETRFKQYSGYKPIPKLRNALEFRQGDILDVMKQIDKSEPSVVMCRNVMPYLSQNYVQEIARNANTRLKKGSLFIIGDFDHVTGIENMLLRSNFEKVQHNVYRKI